MLFRPTQKLATKIKIDNRTDNRTENLVEQNAIADWSANLFVANRQQYVLLSALQAAGGRKYNSPERAIKLILAGMESD